MGGHIECFTLESVVRIVNIYNEALELQQRVSGGLSGCLRSVHEYHFTEMPTQSCYI